VADRLDDNDLLNFKSSLKSSRLGHGGAGDARRLLREHGEAFRAQLVAAMWIEQWLERALEGQRESPSRSEQFESGFESALLEVVAHLRRGDFLPGGRLYEDQISGRWRDPPEAKA